MIVKVHLYLSLEVLRKCRLLVILNKYLKKNMTKVFIVMWVANLEIGDMFT